MGVDPPHVKRTKERHRVRRLPVCEENQVLGIVTLADIADYTRRCLDNLTEETLAER
jgi:CBS domain-containing protein